MVGWGPTATEIEVNQWPLEVGCSWGMFSRDRKVGYSSGQRGLLQREAEVFVAEPPRGLAFLSEMIRGNHSNLTLIIPSNHYWFEDYLNKTAENVWLKSLL